ncbi:MAG: glutaredoxin domain-containing protein [Lawsonella sp.]|nr:hypothetical protein [Mycobacteriales bacterium]
MSNVKAPKAPEKTEDITLYTAEWCPHCQRLKKLLGELNIPFTNVDLEKDDEAEAAEKFVIEVNDGNAVIPTVLFSDGSTMTNPGATKVRDKIKELKANA